MAVVPAASLPARSELEGWQWRHLEDAAVHLRESADESDHVFDQHVRIVADAPWEGQAHDAAYVRAASDRGVAGRQSEVQREAAAIAQNGAGDVRSAKRDALEAIANAENEGFRVGEDLSVHDTRTHRDVSVLRDRQLAADEYAEDIRWTTEQLVATDTLAGRRLTDKAGELETIRFNGEGDGSDDRTIQAVDFEQSPQDGDGKPTLDEILKQYQVGEDPGGTHEIDFPAWADKLAGKEIPTQELTATEIRMLLTNPTKINSVLDIQQQARAEAVKRFPPSDGVREIDNQTDAFRHAYANALMTQKFGEEWTRNFTTAHEGREDNYASSEAMDLYNNEIGRGIAMENPDASSDEMANMVQQAVNNGDTVVIRSDGQGLEWSNNIAPVGTGDSSRSAPTDGAPRPSPYGS